MDKQLNVVLNLLSQKKDTLYEVWMKTQLSSSSLREDLISIQELKVHSKEFLDELISAIKFGNLEDITAAEYSKVLDILGEISNSRAQQGFSPSETSSYIFSLKESIMNLLTENLNNFDYSVLFSAILSLNKLLDNLGLYTFENYVVKRESIISRQQQEIMELSTPVIHVWDGVLAVPVIGTLDSTRSQSIMENLLKEIAATGSQITILDISGVPAMDTLVAQHLMKTVKAARLMGAECIISGIRPVIAQTIVQLGVELSEVKTKASLAGALKLAFDMLELKITKVIK